MDQTQDTIKLKATAAAKSWTRFAVLYLAVFFIGSAAILLLILAIDPYDSGRFPSLRLVGIVDENPRTAVVSRGRDAQFKAAVVGNSHGQLLSPARLSQATGVRFVQLTVPGTGPREQFAVMRWFARHHARIGALVLVADLGWCTQDAKLPMVNPFPFWLYSESDLEYLSNIFSTRSLDLGFRRVMLALGWRTPSDPAGYWDYEAGRPWTFNPPIPEEQPPAASRFEREFSFPAILPLSSHVERLPARTPLIIVMAPIFFTELPRAGSEDAARLAQCKQALARLAAARPGSAFLDYLLDTPMTRDPKNFMDAAHYRADVAKRIEADIARALAAVPAAR